jgi:hypothetical protein
MATEDAPGSSWTGGLSSGEGVVCGGCAVGLGVVLVLGSSVSGTARNVSVMSSDANVPLGVGNAGCTACVQESSTDQSKSSGLEGREGMLAGNTACVSGVAWGPPEEYGNSPVWGA